MPRLLTRGGTIAGPECPASSRNAVRHQVGTPSGFISECVSDLNRNPQARELRSAQRWNVLIFLALWGGVDVRLAKVNFGGCDAGGELRPLSVQHQAQV